MFVSNHLSPVLYQTISHLYCSNGGRSPTDRFQAESMLYGSGCHASRRVGGGEERVAPEASVTIGQEDKRQRQASYGRRLHRLQCQQQAHQAKADQLHGEYDQMQDRRSKTVAKQQTRYEASIHDQRPHAVHRVAPNGPLVYPTTTAAAATAAAVAVGLARPPVALVVAAKQVSNIFA